MAYRPNPIDTSHIELSDALNSLIERLAANNHDLWAKRRMEENWRYGPQRDDTKKETPLLIPYDELPESEKEYDRADAVETLKTIISLGWVIQDPEHPPNLSSTLEEYQQKARHAEADGEALLAYDIATEGLRCWPKDEKLRQIQALALARMGSRHEASAILNQMCEEEKEADTDQELVGLLARIYKDEWLASGSTADLKRACEAYGKAYSRSPQRYWSGINAATLAFTSGASDDAARIAEQVIRTCEEQIDSATGDNAYWLAATIAEAYLLLGDVVEAEYWYGRAANAGDQRLGNILSTWRNARLILAEMSRSDCMRIENALGVPKVAVFAGHRVDAPDRAAPRFPERRAEAVKQEIQARLNELRVRVSYSSAASGSDILFLEALQALGGKTHIVLPCKKEQFVQESVAGSGAQWIARFEAVLKNATEVVIASPEFVKVGGLAWDFSNDLLYGLATLRSRQGGMNLVHMAVWDCLIGDDPGRTARTVRRWQEHTDDVIIIRPAETRSRPSQGPVCRQPTGRAPTPVGIRSELRAFLFADACHFSRLSEVGIAQFVQHFMNPIAMLLRDTYPAPIFQNTWGDGLYFVFSDVREAGNFALKLVNRIASIQRDNASGLPADFALRIALHAGPAYRYKDQIIEKFSYTGSHVTRAARIEPITPPGQIYVTEAFAALSELQAPGEFRLTYVGKIPLAKQFGSAALYKLQPSMTVSADVGTGAGVGGI